MFKSGIGSVASRHRQKKIILIEDPRALPGSSFLAFIVVGLHYLVLAFLFLSARYYTDGSAPTYIFIIPVLAASGGTVVGLLCFLMQNNRYVRKGCEPSTGILLAFAGIIGGAVYCMLIYGIINKDFFQAYQLLEIAAAMCVYYFLVRRRLRFASIAYAEGARSVSQLRLIWFRTLVHSLILLVYIFFWCLLYIQLVDVPAPGSGSSRQNSTFTQADTPQSAVHKWIVFIDSKLPISRKNLESAGKGFLIYNLWVISQVIKGSLWMSVSSVVSDISDNVQIGSKLKIQASSDQNHKLLQNLASVLLLGNMLLVSQIVHTIAEGFRRCHTRRAGALYNLGGATLFLFSPLTSRCNVYGVCRMQKTGNGLIESSLEATSILRRCGMHNVENSDLLCGARLCGVLLLAAAGSILGSTLVTILGFPPALSRDVQQLSFLVVALVGNWGTECAEAWAVAQLLQFAETPEAVYVANPPLAAAIHDTLFGLPRLSIFEAARHTRTAVQASLSARALAAWRDVAAEARESALASRAAATDEAAASGEEWEGIGDSASPEQAAAAGEAEGESRGGADASDAEGSRDGEGGGVWGGTRSRTRGPGQVPDDDFGQA